MSTAPFFTRTPAQIAGLIGPDTSEDQALWDAFKESPEVKKAVDRRKDAKYKARVELLKKREAISESVRAACDRWVRDRDAADVRIAAAEQELSAAIIAKQHLPIYAPSCGAELFAINTELANTADKRIGMMQTWCEREIDRTRGYDAPCEVVHAPNPLEYGTSFIGYDQTVRAGLTARITAIGVAIDRLRAMRLEVLTETEVLTELGRIHGSVPPIPDGACLKLKLDSAPLPKELIQEAAK